MPTDRCEDCRHALESDMPNWVHCALREKYVYISVPLGQCKFNPPRFEPKDAPK